MDLQELSTARGERWVGLLEKLKIFKFFELGTRKVTFLSRHILGHWKSMKLTHWNWLTVLHRLHHEHIAAGAGDISSNHVFVPQQVEYLSDRVETLPEIFPDLQVSGRRVCTLNKWHCITTDYRLLATVVPTYWAKLLLFTPQCNTFLVF